MVFEVFKVYKIQSKDPVWTLVNDYYLQPDWYCSSLMPCCPNKTTKWSFESDLTLGDLIWTMLLRLSCFSSHILRLGFVWVCLCKWPILSPFLVFYCSLTRKRDGQLTHSGWISWKFLHQKPKLCFFTLHSF